MISEGKKRNEIADELFIELETVKTHIKNIYSKLNVNSRSDALKVVKKNRLI
jgi:DNA-binding NarL/FixJ family response regulator